MYKIGVQFFPLEVCQGSERLRIKVGKLRFFEAVFQGFPDIKKVVFVLQNMALIPWGDRGKVAIHYFVKFREKTA